MHNDDASGALDYIVVGFDGKTLNNTILQELEKLATNGLVRIIDLLFVSKDKDGRIEGYELHDLPAEVQVKTGASDLRLQHLLGPADVKQIGDDMGNNMLAAVLVFENLWAKAFKQAIVGANGVLLSEGHISPAAEGSS